MDSHTKSTTSEDFGTGPVPDEFVTPHQLCDICKPLADSLPAYAGQVKSRKLKTPQTSYQHHANLASLAESARRGCHLCSIFTDTLSIWQEGSDAIKEAKIQDPKYKDGVRVVTACHSMTSETKCLRFSIDIHHSESEGRTPYVTVHRHLKNPPKPKFNPFCESPIEREAKWPEESKYRWSKSTGSRAAHAMLSKQLKNCLANHKDCAKGSHPDFKPCRLVDLSPFSNSNSKDVRVVPGSITTSSYATLSYRRGGISPCALNAENYDAFRERIPWSSLPETMRDAITICRRLSVRYIWIDSLCIVQGADGDFQQEAARKQAVYSDSLFTIAAADSSNPHGGCFRERFPLRHVDCRIYEDKNQLIFVKAHAPCDSIMGGKARDPTAPLSNGCTPGNCILDDSAWTFQERMLSPRTLYLGRGDIHFECREGLICESIPSEEGMPSHSYYPALKPMYLRMAGLGAHDFETSYKKFQELWREILEYYSQTVLSHEEDRLLAIAGIVSVPQWRLRLQSSFGLWMPSFLDELCWCIDERTPSSERRVSSFDFVPTWSWMRLVGSKVVNMEEFPYRSEPLDRLYSATVIEYPETTPFVQLPKLSTFRTTLVLEARCVRCRVVKVEDSIGQSKLVLVPCTPPPIEVYGDEEPCDSSAPSNSTLKRLYGNEQGQRMCSFDADRPSTLAEGQTLHCLLVKRYRMTDRFGAVHVWDFCLVLQLERDGDYRVFTRVGVYCEGNSKLDVKERAGKISFDDNDKDDEELMRILVSRRLMFPSEEGEEMEVVIR